MTIQEARKILNPLRNREFDGVLSELYKVRDAARLLGLNPYTIRKRIRAGTITAWGKPLRVRPRDLLVPYEPPCADPDSASGEKDQK